MDKTTLLILVIASIAAIISIINLIISINRSKINSNGITSQKINELIQKQDTTNSNLEKFAGYVNNLINTSNKYTVDGFNSVRQEIAKSNMDQRRELSDTINNMRNTMYSSLDDIHAGLSKQNSDEFFKLRTEITSAQRSQREEINKSNAMMLEQVQSRLKAIEDSNSEALEKIRANVDEQLSKSLNERLAASFSTVNTQLENVYKSIGEMRELSTEVNSLNRIFSNVKSRGTWAEYQLESILDQTIPGMYERNYMPTKNLIVEFAIKIPQKNGQMCYLPVDSKFPVEDYMRIKSAADACNNEELDNAKKALITRIKNQGKEIAKYIIPPTTTPFAIMYLPTEGLYTEVISTDGLAEELQNKYHVMIAGPNTINALLTSLQIGFSAIKINEKADEITAALSTFKSQFVQFNNDLEKVRTHIAKAEESVVSATRRGEKIVKNLNSFELETQKIE